jgi:hypothetical protein
MRRRLTTSRSDTARSQKRHDAIEALSGCPFVRWSARATITFVFEAPACRSLKIRTRGPVEDAGSGGASR